MHGVLLLLLQVAVILVAARLIGWAFRWIGQPQVMGEMVAGIVLGPSLLGWVAPGAWAVLFPVDSLPALGALSQVGLLLFMFLVGLELDPRLLRGRGRAALVTSHASIVAPFLLGAVLALHLYPRYSDESVSFNEFALFMGAAMSVTAFPVLARILAERNLLRTKVGALTIACAAIDDVTAWCILAGVVALVRSSGAGAALGLTLAGAAVYVVLMIWVVSPLLRRLEAHYASRGRITQDIVAIVLLLILASAWTTEWLGIHALFGAFLMGALMPKDPGFVHRLTERFHDLTVVLFLPLFFAYTGLRTKLGLLDGVEPWADCGLVILVAVAGKLGGSAIAARASGLAWREAGAVGVLMNTRGLMELVILTIGLDLGVISPIVFVMMVLMALVTTFMTTPVLAWVYPDALIRSETIGAMDAPAEPGVLLPVSLPSSGPELLAVARALVPAPAARFYALHLLRPEEEELVGSDAQRRPTDQLALKPLLAAAERTGVNVRCLSFVSRSFGEDIAEVARIKAARLVLLGWHKPVIGQSILGGAVYEVMSRTEADVAVYVARRPIPWTRVLVPFSRGPHDLAALELAAKIAQGGAATITVLHVVRPGRTEADPRAGVSEKIAPMGPERLNLKIVESDDAIEAAVQEVGTGYDLVVIGASEEWGLAPTVFGAYHERLAETAASLLIVRAGKKS